MTRKEYCFYVPKIKNRYPSILSLNGEVLFKLLFINEIFQKNRNSQTNTFEDLCNLLLFSFQYENLERIMEYLKNQVARKNRKCERMNNLLLFNFLHFCYILEKLDHDRFHEKFEKETIFKVVIRNGNILVEKKRFILFYDFFKEKLEKHFKIPFFVDSSDIMNIYTTEYFINYSFKDLKKHYFYFFNPSPNDQKYLNYCEKLWHKNINLLYDEFSTRNLYMVTLFKNILRKKENLDFKNTYVFIYYHHGKNLNLSMKYYNEYKNIFSFDSKKNNRIFFLENYRKTKDTNCAMFSILTKENSNLVDFMRILGMQESGYRILESTMNNFVSCRVLRYDLSFAKSMAGIFDL